MLIAVSENILAAAKKEIAKITVIKIATTVFDTNHLLFKLL
jgi:hypothetical protein